MSRTMIIGRSGCGKTTLLIKLLKEIRTEMKGKFEIILISPTAANQKLYQENEEIFDDYFTMLDDTVVQKIFDTNVRLSKRKKKSKELICVFDDVGEDQYFLKRKSKLTDLVISARHRQIHLIFLVQKVKQIAPIYRLNADEAYIFRPTSLPEKKIIMEDFLDDFDLSKMKKLEEYAWKESYDYIKVKREGGETLIYLNDSEEPFEMEKAIKDI